MTEKDEVSYQVYDGKKWVPESLSENPSRTVRRRFTIPENELRLAEEYAELDHRTLSELICEALKQMRHRYPHKDSSAIRTVKELEKRLQTVEKELAFIRENLGVDIDSGEAGNDVSQVHAGTLQRKNTGGP